MSKPKVTTAKGVKVKGGNTYTDNFVNRKALQAKHKAQRQARKLQRQLKAA
jgi:hypothetical protein